MITPTSDAQRRAWRAGVLPPVELVRPGLWAIAVPLLSTRYVIVYAIETANGVVLIDAGWDSDEAWEALTAGLRRIGGSIGDVSAVLVTHMHRDHYGQAGRIRDASGALVAMHPADTEQVAGNANSDARVARACRLLARCGVPDQAVQEIAESVARMSPPLDLPDLALDDGTRVPVAGADLTTIWTPGHSPGHVCFHDTTRRLLFAGDHVLPDITPNVSVHTDHSHNPLADYLASLEKVAHLDPDEVLPAHEYRFRGLETRVGQLLSHHADRLAEVEEHLADEAATPWTIAERMHWSRPWDTLPAHLRRAAVGETLAHLVLLEEQGRSEREIVEGTWYFTRSQSALATPSPSPASSA